MLLALLQRPDALLQRQQGLVDLRPLQPGGLILRGGVQVVIVIVIL